MLHKYFEDAHPSFNVARCIQAKTSVTF